jgi:hypothetical protein
MGLFEFVKSHCSCYPEVLGYHYLADIYETHPPKVPIDDLNKYEFVFISSDFAFPIPGFVGFQFLTSSESPGSWMWLQQEFSNFVQMSPSEYTEVPSVGFVGRCPGFGTPNGGGAIHAGFEPRYKALERLMWSDDICVDFHIHTKPDGDSAGFWNDTRADYKKNAPLFKNNMLANQYQLCARGNANWSLRFYETLAYGRIPVYVESGGKFPVQVGGINDFEELVGGFPFPVVFDIADIEKTILEFHEGLRNQDGLVEAQKACAVFYDEWFSQEAQIREFKFRFEEYIKED